MVNNHRTDVNRTASLVLEATATALSRIALLAEQTGDSMLQRFAAFLADLSLALSQAWLGASTFDRVLDETLRRAMEGDERVHNWLQSAIAHHEPGSSGLSRNLLHGVLYQGLVDIRTHAYNARLTDIFNLADVFHNAPVGVVSVMDDVDPDEHLADIVANIRVRAQRRNCEHWLEQTVPALLGDFLSATASEQTGLSAVQ